MFIEDCVILSKFKISKLKKLSTKIATIFYDFILTKSNKKVKQIFIKNQNCFQNFNFFDLKSPFIQFLKI